MKMPLVPLAALGLALAMQSARADTWSVGPDAACTHADLQAAINAARLVPAGPHLIKMSAGERLLTTEVFATDPASDLVIEGGYASCDAALPDEDGRTVLRQTATTRLLRVASSTANGRRYFTLRRLTLTGASAPTNLGGAVLAQDRASLVLDRQTRIEGNRAAHGGGVALLGTAELATTEVILTGGSSINDNEATDPLGMGGGIYIRGYGTARLIDGQVSNNLARWGGGGVALDHWGTFAAALHVNPPANPDPDSPVVLSGNVAGGETFSAGEGFGGAIYSNMGRIDITAPDVGLFTTLLVQNQANHGGAVYVHGPASDTHVTYVDIRNAWVAGNIARGKGGAFYSRNRVQWQVSHSTRGDCLLGGQAFPCSVIAGNEARNETTPGQRGGGVGYMTNSVGTPGGTFRFFRTLFSDNDDVDGSAAIAVAYYDSALIFERCAFFGNRAGSSGGVLLANAAGMDTHFAYNTVLGNDVDSMFSMDGGTLRTQGSILWHPGQPIWSATNGASMLHEACLIAHDDANLPAGVTVVEPDLDARLAPRGGSPAIDHCDERGLVPLVDLYRQESGHDAAGVQQVYGHHDLGAVENRDIVFFSGFGTRFAN